MSESAVAQNTEIDTIRELDVLAKKIDELDLDPIKVKLMDADEGEGWTLEEADEAEKWYKRFLFLSAKYPNTALVPVTAIDKFWHQHILDTRKYAADCECIFGYFLHHFPYFGMRGEQDAADLAAAGDDTMSIFESEFGESPLSAANKCHSCKKCRACFVCNSGCKHEGCSQKCTKHSPIDVDSRPKLVR